MFQIVKNVLTAGDYDLNAITKKIKTLWVENELTDAQYAELVQQAKDGAKAENSIDIVDKLEELDKRLIALEKADNTTEQTVADFAEGKWYYTGDKISFEGENYVCIAPEGTVCVWSPKGYPAYWGKA